MAPRGEIAVTLNTDEVQVLKQALEALCADEHTSHTTLLNAILEKIRMAEQKML